MKQKIQHGWMVRPGSFWVGTHWSPGNKRLCINLVPFVTLWLVWPGGNVPKKEDK